MANNLDIHKAIETFVKKYYVNQIVKGLLLLLLLLLPLFLLFSTLEYFQYMPSTTRAVLYFSFLGIALLLTGIYIVAPIFKLLGLSKSRLSTNKAAEIIGNHFPEIQDKLLNTLQLLECQTAQKDNELLLAGIQQKVNQIKPFNFNLAINRKNTLKYGKYAGLAFLLLFVVALFKGNMLKEGSERLINYNKNYARKAPFVFHFAKPKTVKKGENVELNLKDHYLIILWFMKMIKHVEK